jgi:hypothetical protein
MGRDYKSYLQSLKEIKMIAHNVFENEVINIIEVESLTSFTPEAGELLVLPDTVEIGFYNYGGVWKKKREYIEPQIIEKRKQKLVESDIAMLPDNYAKLSEAQKEAWATYRQALRDITAQAGYPWDIQWPTKPQA